MTLLDAALRYAALGFRVFPVAPRDKVPLLTGAHPEGDPLHGRCKGECGKDGHGCHDGTTDEGKIRAWWAEHQYANIGVSTGKASGLWVLDLDGEDGINSMAALESENGRVENAPQVETGGGGSHLWFAHDPRARQGARILPGVDARTDGGYVVAPPSIHPNGLPYGWLHGIEPTARLAAAPEWLISVVKKPKRAPAAPPANGHTQAQSGGMTAYGRKALDGLLEELSAVPVGARDDRRNTIAYSAGRLVAGGHITDTDAEEALVIACVNNGLVGEEGEEEIRKRMRAAIEAGKAAGPRGPAPNPPKIVVSAAGVEEREDHDEQQTDVGNGRRLVRRFGDNLHWSRPLGWLAWDGERWARDDRCDVFRLAKESAKEMRIEAETLDGDDRKAARKHALASEKAERIRAAISMAQSEPRMFVRAEDLDANPWLLTVSNGTLDLRTGTLGPHLRKNLATKVAFASYDKKAKCERWLRFLSETFDDPAVIDFLHKAIGYTLTGITTEQVFFLCHGQGSNGKSTLLSVIRLLLGDLAANADFSTFLATKAQSHGPRGDLARLAGVRLVTSTEPDGGGAFSESTIKAITGQDPITCAFKFQDEFSYVPQFKLWLAANHKPRIRGRDHAIWRRPRLIPFDNIVPDEKQDKELGIALAHELAGILSWAVEGCKKWQKEGLKPPEKVVLSTQKYREEQDTLAEFLEDCCNVTPSYDCLAGDLYAAYRKWAESENEEPVSKNLFGRMMTERGFELDRNTITRERIRLGIALKPGVRKS